MSALAGWHTFDPSECDECLNAEPTPGLELVGMQVRHTDWDADGRLVAASSINLGLVGVHEIAERIGVKVHTIHQWRRRHEDFPPPIQEFAMGPVWAWPQIVGWLDATGRVRIASEQASDVFTGRTDG